MDEVCCADCGLLAAMDRESRELVHVELGLRLKWGSPSRERSWKMYEDYPVCVGEALNFEDETKGNNAAALITQIIKESRRCKKFFKWHVGFSPKEHIE